MEQRIVIYTAITGGKDPKRDDILCFSEYNQFTRPVMNAKIYKILPHQFIDADISVWIDGNIKLLIPLEEFVDEFLGDFDMGVWEHFDRDCVYEEGEAAKGLGGDYTIGIDEQLRHYRRQGFQEHWGLAECNVLVRRHTPLMEEFNNAWWAEICRWSCRDQISFPYVLSQFPQIEVKFNEGNPREHHNFSYIPH